MNWNKCFLYLISTYSWNSEEEKLWPCFQTDALFTRQIEYKNILSKTPLSKVSLRFTEAKKLFFYSKTMESIRINKREEWLPFNSILKVKQRLRVFLTNIETRCTLQWKNLQAKFQTKFILNKKLMTSKSKGMVE